MPEPPHGMELEEGECMSDLEEVEVWQPPVGETKKRGNKPESKQPKDHVVTVAVPKVTVITDVELRDDAMLDGYFQFVYERGTTMLGLRQLIKEHVIDIKHSIVWLLVGNCQVLIAPQLSLGNQLKKLITTIVRVYPLSVGKVWVGGVFHHLDWEVELEADIKSVNKGYAQAVQDLKRFLHLGKRVAFVPTHKLFLERYKYCDLASGQDACMT